MVSQLLCRSALGVALLASLSFFGCQRGPKLVEVKGKIFLDGQPLTGASVSFYPVGPGQVAVCTSDTKGEFFPETGNNKGVFPGKYKVTVLKLEIPGANKGNDETMSVGPSIDQLKSLIPKKYDSDKTTDLEVTVPSEVYELKLSSK